MKQLQGIIPAVVIIIAGIQNLHGAGNSAPPFVAGSATLVVIPDTECIVCRSDLFPPMMQWILDNKDGRNIAGVLHVGDITNNNTRHEWECSRKAFDLIEGKIPYVLAAGNHDYDHTEGRLTYMNEYFHVEGMQGWGTFGDVYEPGKLENHYQFLTIHGRKWLVLSLEMGPRRKVIDWAGKILRMHKDRMAIILTHGYLYYGNERYNHLRGGQRATPYNFYGEGADGEMLWNQLVRRHPNIMMVICGHLSSQYVGYRKDEGAYGNIVHQMLVDYEKLGGAGTYLRLLEFLPDKKTVQVRTYSPVTGKTNPRNPDLEEFTFELQPATRTTAKTDKEIAARPLSRSPVHRYSFKGRGGSGAGKQSVVADTLGLQHGMLRSGAALNGRGQLLLEKNGHVQLPPHLLDGLSDASFELWFTPTAAGYRWNSTFRFGGKDDWFTYVFRTLTVHRAELAVNGHNNDIQCTVPVETGKELHVVITYDHDGADGKPLLKYYRNGSCFGEMPTGLQLEEIDNPHNVIGPFAGVFDEFRIYDYPLTGNEVLGTFAAGPDKLTLAQGVQLPKSALSFDPEKPPSVPGWARGETHSARPPVHRYSFSGKGGHGAWITDAIGKRNGRLHAPKGSGRLNGKGQLVLDTSDAESAFALLQPGIVKGRKELSIELWFTPTGSSYNWTPAFHFKSTTTDDWLWYCFRSKTCHRAELCNAGHNEDIQKKGISVSADKPLHIVVAYTQNGPEGRPLLQYFRNGKLHGSMKTGIKLADLDITRGQIGPFEGIFDEFRVYDFALTEKEVHYNFEAGPDNPPAK